MASASDSSADPRGSEKVSQKKADDMANLRCINPNCQAEFALPPGEEYAACPMCNTWHFIADADLHASDSSGLSKDNYAAPPVAYPEGSSSLADLPMYEMHPPPLAAQGEGKANEIASEAVPTACLVTGDGQRFPLRAGRNIIGRKNCDIVLSDKSVSRRHCVVEVQAASSGTGWEYIVYDIGHLEGSASSNGVFLSNRTPRLQNYERIPLRKGLVLEVGRIKLKLEE